MLVFGLFFSLTLCSSAVAEPTTVFNNWYRRDNLVQSPAAAASTNSVPASVGSFSDGGSIEPTNSTNSLNNILSLGVTGNVSSLRIVTDVAALTAVTGRSIIKSGKYEGFCVGKLIPAEKNRYIAWPDIALISCDDEEEAMDLVVQSASQSSDCILLYSLKSTACNLTSANKIYTSQLGFVMTFLSTTVAESVISNIEAGEYGDFTGVAQAMTITTAASGSSDSSSGTGKPQRSTLAMAILYSVTGVVAFLFLFVIISGAIRVHTHPERYGLQRSGGDSNDNDNAQYTNMHRAKGIARAVLDSIPLVTVRVRPKESKESIETLELEPQSNAQTSRNVEPKSETVIEETPISISPTHISTNTPLVIDDDDDSMCPICFEKFEDGQILRILPCKHQFHALCVDPWLLNSSTHCPMCRVDLSISQQEAVPDHPPGMSTDPNDQRTPIVIPEGYEVDTSLFNRFLDVWNAHLLPRDARRAALARFQGEAELRRQLRSQQSSSSGLSSSTRNSIFHRASSEHRVSVDQSAPAQNNEHSSEPIEEQNEEEHIQNQNLWLRFVASRRKLHQLRGQRNTPNNPSSSPSNVSNNVTSNTTTTNTTTNTTTTTTPPSNE